MKAKRGRTVRIGGVSIGGGMGLALIAGPCVIENRDQCLAIARRLQSICRACRVPLVFKASYDKANRSSIQSYRGVGLREGLAILAEVRDRTGVPVLTDVHSVAEVGPVAEVVDVIQIPAFLCRQTDLLLAAGRSGKPVNVKKAQFLSPEDMANVVAKIASTGNRNLLLTERGACFGYNNLVSDMRSLPVLRSLGYPVVYDATHSVQRPGAGGTRSAGDAKFVPALARAAVAAGCDAIFLETYVDGTEPLSDKENSVRLGAVGPLLRVLRRIHGLVSAQ